MRLILFTILLLISVTCSDSYVDRNNYTGQGALNLQIQNITDTSAHVSWTHDAITEILKYELTANVIQTYSKSKIYPLKLTFSNNTLRTEISGLHPTSKYNVTLRIMFKNAQNVETSKLFDTDLSEPDQVAQDPEILVRDGSTMVVRLFPVENNNGPVSFYRIIVLNADYVYSFHPDLLHAYYHAKDEGISYYIAADVDAQYVNRNFTIGDEKYYNGFYNGPLDERAIYTVYVGVVSTLNAKSRVRYPTISSLRKIETIEDSSQLIIILWVAILLGCLLLIVGLFVLVLLRRRFHRNRRQRLSDNQELSIRGSMIQVANHGYINDEDMGRANHYDALKQMVWNIPRDCLQVNAAAGGESFLGFGKFGHVVQGTVQKKNDKTPTEVACYIVTDGDLNQQKKKMMLRDLDLLVKSGTHENLATLIGTCENPETVYIVLEHSTLVLKDYLLSHRQPSNSKCTAISELQVCDYLIGIANGMYHLTQKQVFHERLCARNVLIFDNRIPKITGLGLSHYNRGNFALDFTRWTAQEILNGKPYCVKSDVWSFGCLAWETCSLGGTPYSLLDGKRVSYEVCRGVRLPKLPNIGEELYQFLLTCWQCDPDERPTFYEIIQQLQYFKDTLETYSHINFDLTDDFNYEPFMQRMETAEECVTQTNITY